MATNTQLKFYKVNGMPASGLVAGAIYFDKKTGVINVATSTSAYECYGGRISETEWLEDKKILYITKNNGDKIELNFSDIASASDVSSKLQAINNTLDSHNTRINTAQAAAEAAQTAANTADAKAVKEAEDRAAEITRVEGLISAEAVTARAAEEANAAAAAAADGKAVAAQTYAENVNTALGNEVTRATEKEQELADAISEMEAAYKEADETILGQIQDIVAGAISVEGVTGDKYVEVTQDGTKYIVKSKGVDDAIAVEKDRAEAAESSLSNRIDALASAGDAEGNGKGRVTVLEEQVRALNAATHFEGKVEGDSFAEAVAASGKTYESGDIVIYGDKEFIYDGKAWIELGDTTAESDRITQLETWKSTAADDIAANTANIAAVVKDLADNYATDAELTALANGAVKTNTDKIAEIEGEVDLNTAAVADHKGRIEALESTANALGTTYVKVSDYNTYKGEVSDLFEDVDGRVGALESFKSTTESTLGDIATAQGQQDEAIEAAAALGQQGVDDAAAALAEAQAKVASVTSGDAYAVVDNTDAKNPQVKVNVNGAVSENNTGIVTGGAVYEALCWVEFN